MQKNINITLGKHFEEFIALQIRNGQFSSASEIIRAGLRLLEEKELKLDMLRQALNEGEKSGFVQYSFDNLIEELDREFAD